MSILVDDSNKTACRAAEAGLQQKNCAALVRPAGTGKGCIVWELLDAHPEMRVLWVVSCAARLELRRALTKRLGRTLGGRVRLMSCEQLAVQNALGWVALAEFRPGLLVLDGWREMSAKDWTDCVQPLFRLCPGAKLLALGEPDAPGDSCRAAEEMLADAIVEPLALGGAMAEGLLPMPASYTALLWPLEDAMARLRAEVKNLHLPGCPDPNAEKYQALSLAVEKLPPVEQLLAQWLPDAAGRCLVLCEDDAAAAQTAEQAEKLFGAGTHIYKDAEGFAADEAATLRLLVCANGPAVQAPLAGISGVVLVRRSAGPAAYRQMLARALAACGSVPVAELSAAFEALTCVQQLRKECSAAGAEAFPLEEPLSACRRAYRQLRRALDSDWERYYAAAKQMTAEGKTLDVPRSYRFGGVAVGRWLENQRLVRAGKKKGRLTAEQAARLDKIGMNWKKRLELAWENGCASARRYRGSHSDLLVPVHYKDKDGFALGEWIVYNRQRYLSGNLPPDRVERLEALGMVWDTGSILWEKSYAAAVQYYLENHTLEIPVKYVTPDGMALGVWLGSQRAAYKEGVLTDAQIEKLEALEVDWTNRNDRKWQTAYEAAVKYHAAHGNLDVPTEYTDENGILLGKWVSRQRYAWQNPGDAGAESSAGRVGHELGKDRLVAAPLRAGRGIQKGARQSGCSGPVPDGGRHLAGQLAVPSEADAAGGQKALRRAPRGPERAVQGRKRPTPQRPGAARVQRAGAELAGQLPERQALRREEGQPPRACRIRGRERLPSGRLDLEPPGCPQGPARLVPGDAGAYRPSGCHRDAVGRPGGQVGRGVPPCRRVLRRPRRSAGAGEL